MGQARGKSSLSRLAGTLARTWDFSNIFVVMCRGRKFDSPKGLEVCLCPLEYKPRLGRFVY